MASKRKLSVRHRSLLFAVGIAVMSTAAAAQTAPQQPQAPAHPTPDSLNASIGTAWNSAAQVVGNVGAIYGALYADWLKKTKEYDDLMVYAKSCGDKPGCFTPAGPPLMPPPSKPLDAKPN